MVITRLSLQRIFRLLQGLIHLLRRRLIFHRLQDLILRLEEVATIRRDLVVEVAALAVGFPSLHLDPDFRLVDIHLRRDRTRQDLRILLRSLVIRHRRLNQAIRHHREAHHIHHRHIRRQEVSHTLHHRQTATYTRT